MSYMSSYYTYTGWLKKSKLLYCVNSLLFWATLYITTWERDWRRSRSRETYTGVWTLFSSVAGLLCHSGLKTHWFYKSFQPQMAVISL